MEIRLIHIFGARKGQTQAFHDPKSIKFGRQPGNDVAFDAKEDIRASGNHAEIRLEEGRFLLYDLNSTNGTFVNGNRVSERQVLKDGDVIEFGKGGPQVRCEIPAAAPATLRATSVSAGEGAQKSGGPGVKTVQMMIQDALAQAKQSRGGRFGSTTVFMREMVSQAVTKSSQKLRIVSAVIVVLLLGSVGGLIYMNAQLKKDLRVAANQHRQELTAVENNFKKQLSESQQRTQAIQEQLDQAQRDATVSRAQMQAMQDMLNQEQDRTAAIMDDLQRTRSQLTNLDNLSNDLLKSLKSFQEVAAENRESIFMIAIMNKQDFSAEPIGTGFAVSGDGLLTNAHVAVPILQATQMNPSVVGVAIMNKRPEVIYEISNIQIHPQYNESKSYRPDLAYLQVNTGGGSLKPVKFPPAGDLTRLESGYDLAVLGFPGITMDVNNPIATLSTGAVGRMIESNYIQHNCETSGGNSGSPIFNKNGEVVGVHYSGLGNVTVVVPAPALDPQGNVLKNPDGSDKVTMVTKRIKEAVGINIGVRADVALDFLRMNP
ncbi:MAG: trypsin-like peptidase domain-containing protein [Calditrichaceae bacterium]|nr:trypsin-like peptidase domain-containing protein [Calditrichaceae bacterium]